MWICWVLNIIAPWYPLPTGEQVINSALQMPVSMHGPQYSYFPLSVLPQNWVRGLATVLSKHWSGNLETASLAPVKSSVYPTSIYWMSTVCARHCVRRRKHSVSSRPNGTSVIPQIGRIRQVFLFCKWRTWTSCSRKVLYNENILFLKAEHP